MRCYKDLINKVKSWDTDSDVDWSQWIDTEIPDDIDNLKELFVQKCLHKIKIK